MFSNLPPRLPTSAAKKKQVLHGRSCSLPAMSQISPTHLEISVEELVFQLQGVDVTLYLLHGSLHLLHLLLILVCVKKGHRADRGGTGGRDLAVFGSELLGIVLLERFYKISRGA